MPGTAQTDDMQEVEAVFDILGLATAAARAQFGAPLQTAVPTIDVRVVISSSSEPFAS